jgi:hypothetical protein
MTFIFIFTISEFPADKIQHIQDLALFYSPSVYQYWLRDEHSTPISLRQDTLQHVTIYLCIKGFASVAFVSAYA